LDGSQTGATQNYKYRGITPRALAQIFREIQDKPEMSVVVRISYLEIYNEMLYDLLADRDEAAAVNEDLQVMDDAKGARLWLLCVIVSVSAPSLVYLSSCFAHCVVLISTPLPPPFLRSSVDQRADQVGGSVRRGGSALPL
jgi:hypothetical protein